MNNRKWRVGGMGEYDYGYSNEPMFSRYCDEHGRPTMRTPDTHRYSFDPYVLMQSGSYSDVDNADYSDRLFEWDSEKFRRLEEEVWAGKRCRFENAKIGDIEKFLRLYHNLPALKLIMVMMGANHATGYPYYVFMYKTNRTKDEAAKE